ncbi:MAG: BatA domain-containing protein, partial [Gammaproteobacteria bacterium]|nr:BatA domain-containing protein [Gammaproteobacteria bacterium]
MFFASAAFLTGLICLGVPWWLHRLSAHASEQRTFSSLFLMRPSEAPVHMRRKLQHLWLLALRLLLLTVICFAFA